MRRLILAAALAAATSSLAFVPAMADIDNAGVDDLGVDISSVTLTPSAVHNFVSALAPEVRRGVEAACANYDQHPAGMDEQTLNFCANLGRA